MTLPPVVSRISRRLTIKGRPRRMNATPSSNSMVVGPLASQTTDPSLSGSNWPPAWLCPTRLPHLFRSSGEHEFQHLKIAPGEWITPLRRIDYFPGSLTEKLGPQLPLLRPRLPTAKVLGPSLRVGKSISKNSGSDRVMVCRP